MICFLKFNIFGAEDCMYISFIWIIPENKKKMIYVFLIYLRLKKNKHKVSIYQKTQKTRKKEITLVSVLKITAITHSSNLNLNVVLIFFFVFSSIRFYWLFKECCYANTPKELKIFLVKLGDFSLYFCIANWIPDYFTTETVTAIINKLIIFYLFFFQNFGTKINACHFKRRITPTVSDV